MRGNSHALATRLPGGASQRARRGTRQCKAAVDSARGLRERAGRKVQQGQKIGGVRTASVEAPCLGGGEGRRGSQHESSLARVRPVTACARETEVVIRARALHVVAGVVFCARGHLSCRRRSAPRMPMPRKSALRPSVGRVRVGLGKSDLVAQGASFDEHLPQEGWTAVRESQKRTSPIPVACRTYNINNLHTVHRDRLYRPSPPDEGTSPWDAARRCGVRAARAVLRGGI